MHTLYRPTACRSRDDSHFVPQVQISMENKSSSREFFYVRDFAG